MPISYPSTAKPLKPYQRAVSDLIRNYQVEQHLPHDFHLTVDVIPQQMPPASNPAVSIDLANQKLRVYPQFLLQNQAGKETQESLVQLVSSAADPRLRDPRLFELRFKSDTERKLKSDKWCDKAAKSQEMGRVIETEFRQNVMGPLLLATLSPQNRYAVTQNTVDAVPANMLWGMLGGNNGVCYFTEHALARQLFNDAVQRVLPSPPGSTQHVPAQIGSNMQFQSPELDAFVRRLGEDWFARTEKLGKIASPVKEVEQSVFSTIRSGLVEKRLPVPTTENPISDRDARQCLLDALNAKKSQWIYPQETDGVYQGPIVFNEEGYVGQLVTSPDVLENNANRGWLVLHAHANFGAESLPPVCPWVDVTVSYLDGQAVCLPMRRQYLSSEQSLRDELVRLQLSDRDGIPADPSANSLLAMTPLHWAAVSQGQRLLGRWDQAPEELLERVNLEAVRTLNRDLAASACANAERVARTPFDPSLQSWRSQLQEAEQRSQIKDRERYAFEDMQSSALYPQESMARQAVVDEWQQTQVQGLGRQEFFKQEADQRRALGDAQAQAQHVLQASALDAMQDMQRENLQQQAQKSFETLQLNATLEGARQDLQAVEHGQRQEIGRAQAQAQHVLQTLALDAMQDMQRQNLQQQEQSNFEALRLDARLDGARQTLQALERDKRQEIARAQIAEQVPIQGELQTLQALHLQQQRAALEIWNKDLSAQARTLAQQEQIFQLRQEESGARLEITGQQQEKLWNLRSEALKARQEMLFKTRESAFDKRERSLGVLEQGAQHTLERVQEQRKMLREETAELNQRREALNPDVARKSFPMVWRMHATQPTPTSSHQASRPFSSVAGPARSDMTQSSFHLSSAYVPPPARSGSTQPNAHTSDAYRLPCEPGEHQHFSNEGVHTPYAFPQPGLGLDNLASSSNAAPLHSNGQGVGTLPTQPQRQLPVPPVFASMCQSPANNYPGR